MRKTRRGRYTICVIMRFEIYIAFHYRTVREARVNVFMLRLPVYSNHVLSVSVETGG